MAVVIGSLLVDLRASTAAFAKDLSKIEQISFNTAKSIERSWGIVGNAMGAAVTAAVGGMIAGIQKTAEWEVHIGHLAEAAGTTTETMSGLSFAAKMMGLEIDQVAKAMERFDKQVAAAQAGNVKAQQNMSILGVDVRTLKTSDEALMKLADHIAAMPAGMARTAAAASAFGVKLGPSMVPLLIQGSKGMKDFMDQAKAMGLVITTKQFHDAEVFEQNITRMESSLHGLWVNITNETLPALNALTTHFQDTEKTKGFWSALNEFASVTPYGPDYIKKGQEIIDIQEKNRKAIEAIVTKTNEHKNAIDALRKSMESLVEKETIASQTVGMSAAGVHLYTLGVEAAKLGDSAWAAGKIELIRQLEQQTKGLKQIEDFELRQGQRKIDLADKLTLLKLETRQMQEQLDISMRMGSGPGLLGASSEAFTASITEQTKALEHQIVTFGMTSDAIARYDLAMLGGGTDAQKLIANFQGLQVQLAGIQHAADLATKASQANAAAWKTFGEIADRSLNDLIFSGKKFTDVLKDITKLVGEMLLKWSLFGTSGKGGIFGAIGSALGISGLHGFASGGSVGGGQPVMVGEQGPELFIPAMSGRIIPNGAVGGGVIVNYNIDARGSSITEEQYIRGLQAVENRAVRRALTTAREVQLRTS